MNRIFMFLGIAVFAAVCFIDPAMAQGDPTKVTPAATAVSVVPTFFDTYIMPAISLAATAIVGWVVSIMSSKFKVDIDAGHRAALQTAVTNGAALVASKGMSFAIDYVQKSVPDALKRFGLANDKKAIELKIEAKQAVLETATPVAEINAKA